MVLPRVQLFLVLLFFCSTHSVADEPDFRISKRGVLTSPESPLARHYFVDFDLGELPAGKNGLVELAIENPFDHEFHFDSLVPGCSCVQLKSSAKSIPAKGSVNISFRMTTPPRQEKAQISSQISLKISGADGVLSSNSAEPRLLSSDVVEPATKSMARLNFSYKLAGNLAFQGRVVVLEIPEHTPTAELRVPFVFTDPVSFDNLQIQVTRPLRDIEFKLEKGKADDEAVLVGVAAFESVRSGPISGEVFLVDRVSGRKDSILCTVKRLEPFKISPLIFEFRQIEGETDHLVANGVVQIANVQVAQEAADSGIILSDQLEIKCTSQGTAIRVELQPLGAKPHRFYRMKLFLPETSTDSDSESEVEVRDDLKEQKLIFDIQLKNEAYRIERIFSIDR